jgi:hypothetical protein
MTDELSTIPGTVIGYTRRGPVRLLAGGAPRDGDSVEDDTEDDGDGTEDDGTDDDGTDSDDAVSDNRRNETPESLKRALRRERGKVRAMAAKVAQMEAQMGHSTSKGKARRDAQRDAEADEEQIRTAARAQADAEWGARLLVSEAITELTAAGVKGNPRRVARMLELDEVTITGGKVDLDALRDAIEDLKEDSPELFRRTRNRPDADEDEEDDATPRSRRNGRTNTDLGRRTSAKSTGVSALEKALHSAVGIR